jgi:hypothetical protein
MRKFQTTDYSGQLAVVANISGRVLDASLAELRATDDLILALRSALSLGVPIDELSAETGFSPSAIRNLVARNLTFGEDLAGLSGAKG